MLDEGLAVRHQIVSYATQSNWVHAHRLTHIDQIATTEGTKDEADWWNGHLSQVAQTLSALRIFNMARRGMAPAVIGEDSGVDLRADFVLARFR